MGNSISVKRSICRLCVFSLFGLVLLILANEYLERSLLRFDAHFLPLFPQHHELISHDVNANIVIMGSSKLRHSINPFYLDEKGKTFYNFSVADASQSYFNIWSKYLKKYYPRPDWVVIEASNHTLRYDNIKTIVHAVEAFPLPLLWDALRDPEFPADYKTILKSKNKSIYLVGLLFLPRVEKEQRRDYHGYLPDMPTSRQLTVFDESFLDYASYDLNRVKNTLSFIKLVDRLHHDKIKIILVDPPNFKPNLVEDLNFTRPVKNIANRYDNVILLDYAKHENITEFNYNPINFADALHQSSSGAADFSKRLKQDLDDYGMSYSRARDIAVLSSLSWGECVGYGRKARSISDHETAQLYFAEAVRKAEGFGSHDPRLLTALEELSEILREKGDPGSAEPFLQRVSKIREEYSEADQAGDAIALSYLSWGKCVEYAQRANHKGDLMTARLYFESALEKAEKFNPYDPRLTVSMTDLARLYQKMGLRSSAEPLLKRVMSLHSSRLGALHPDLISAKDDLARFYMDENRFEEVFPLSSWESYVEFGMQARKKGDLSKARQYFEESFKRAEKYGLENKPYLVTSLNHLSAVLREQGQPASAEPFMKRSLALLVKNQDVSHPDAMAARDELGKFYVEQGRIDEALALLPVNRHIEHDMKQTEDPAIIQRYLSEARKKAESFEPRNPELSAITSRLVKAYVSNARSDEAEDFLRHLLVKVKYLGDSHPNKIALNNELGLLYVDRAQLDKALPYLSWDRCIEYAETAKRKGDFILARSYYEEALKKAPSMPTTDPRLLKTYLDLADILNAQGLFADTERALKKALQVHGQALWWKAFSDLAGILNAEALFFDFSRTLRKASDIQAARHSDPDMIVLQNKLGALYAGQNMHDKALPLMSADKCIDYAGKMKQAGNLAMAQLYFVEGIRKSKKQGGKSVPLADVLNLRGPITR